MKFKALPALSLFGLLVIPVQAELLDRYTFDNSSNRLEDTSGKGNTAVAAGGVDALTTYTQDTISGATTTVFGNLANVTSSLALPNTIVTSASTAYSVTGWIKTTDNVGYFFGQRDSDATPDRLIITPASSNGVIYNGSTWTSGTKTWANRQADFLNGQWHHFACVVDGTSVTVYRDGVVYDTMTMAAVGSGLKPMSATQRQRFGLDGDPNNSSSEMEGKFDDLRLYNHALTADVVALIHNPNVDFDADGLPDGWELSMPGITSLTELNGTLPAGSGPGSGTGDYDGDGLSDMDEYTIGTGPTIVDTDGDTISDGNEISGLDASGATHTFGATNPKLSDSDSDGIRDDRELEGRNTSGTLHGFGATNPNSTDSDSDGMSDPYELANVLNGGLNPNSNDANGNLDGDASGWTNLQEFSGTHTGGTQTRADSLDTDGDGLEDIVENKSGVWSSQTSTGTNPTLADTDGDGLNDSQEKPDLTFPGAGVTPTNSNPNLTDTDGDGLRDINEVNAGTNPALADTDGDTHSDRTELLNGSDPTSAASTPANTAISAKTDFGGGLAWINTGAGVSPDPSSPLLTGGGNCGLLTSNSDGSGAMLSFANPNAIVYYSIDVRYSGTLDGQGFNIVSSNAASVQTSPSTHCALRFQTNGSFGYSNGTTFNSTAAPAGTHLPDHTYTVQMVHDVPNDTYTIQVFDRSDADRLIFEVTPAAPTRNTTPGGTIYFGAGTQQQSSNAFQLRLDNLVVSSSSIPVGEPSTPTQPAITAIFFQGGDLKIQFSPGGSGYILMSSDDLVAPFTQESNATYDGVNTFTVPAAHLNPGRDFFRVQTSP